MLPNGGLRMTAHFCNRALVGCPVESSVALAVLCASKDGACWAFPCLPAAHRTVRNSQHLNKEVGSGNTHKYSPTAGASTARSTPSPLTRTAPTSSRPVQVPAASGKAKTENESTRHTGSTGSEPANPRNRSGDPREKHVSALNLVRN